eukprot:2096940-Amphidinium_carterae.1
MNDSSLQRAKLEVNPRPRPSAESTYPRLTREIGGAATQLRRQTSHPCCTMPGASKKLLKAVTANKALDAIDARKEQVRSRLLDKTRDNIKKHVAPESLKHNSLPVSLLTQNKLPCSAALIHAGKTLDGL